ncbi:TOBE domain-containing protein [Brachybacterium saurashtrense]|uniref:MerR family transcriptional regulator n=1 Tax=Brachybacterium saurashtrense TaxID=556288 RepID=A0A345YMY4_9MICO|nr:TOBE domain-containing protein [Brachybacterium saurashtrense]AXK45286.1 MerR family transcriptional regulator [Brachybacterium saurashtrense]RRR21958.1 MerR family transcriptional regulator [Brachybacterium saurashtrense]
MTQLRVREAALFLGVSEDTVRRRVEKGALEAGTDAAGRMVLDGAEVARLARDLAVAPDVPGTASSARNRFVGLVTDVVMDTVMAQVELQCGPFRVVSLMSSEAARELELAPGAVATASVKATQVVIEAAPVARTDGDRP